MVTIKSKREIELMREACHVAAMAQQAVEKAIKPGVSTFELDRIGGAYWKGDAKNKMMTRIYVLCFETAEELRNSSWVKSFLKVRILFETLN